MPFPDLGYSYNALCVPLTSDWQCLLVPAVDVEDVDRGWTLSYEERQKKRKEREEQIEQDRRDFDRLFRVSINQCPARACSDFSAYVRFIREHLCISGLAPPIDGETVTCILRYAVRNGWLIPAIDRTWRGSRRVARFYAPQSWPKRAPDPSPTVYGVRDGQFIPLDDDGCFIDRAPYVPVAARFAATVCKAASSSGTGWLGDGGNNSRTLDKDIFSDATDGMSTPLGGTQAFEYGRDDAGIFGDDLQTAWLPSTGGPPNQWVENTSGKQQWRLYDGDGNAAVDIDFGHDHGFGAPHAHNWDHGVRDKVNAFYLLPY